MCFIRKFIFYVLLLCFVLQVPHIGDRGRQCEGLTKEDTEKIQFFNPVAFQGASPSPDNDTIGFFIAKFRKKRV